MVDIHAEPQDLSVAEINDVMNAMCDCLHANFSPDAPDIIPHRLPHAIFRRGTLTGYEAEHPTLPTSKRRLASLLVECVSNLESPMTQRLLYTVHADRATIDREVKLSEKVARAGLAVLGEEYVRMLDERNQGAAYSWAGRQEERQQRTGWGATV